MSAPSFIGLRQLFSPSLVDNNHVPVPYVWTRSEQHALCYDPNRMRVHARIWHDGCGKWYPTVYVSIYRAIRLLIWYRRLAVRLRSFPLIGLEFCRLKHSNIEDAVEDFEGLMIELRIIRERK